ncbi:MAG: UbiA family prenyltransferase [Bacteroidia bacterium]
MKALTLLIKSNIYISLAAVLLTISTQVQIEMDPQWHPYLFLIFFATLFEYNLHRLITVLTNRDALRSDKHNWVNSRRNGFYLLMIFSVLGFIIAVLQAKLKVLLTLAPIAGLTLFYSTPISRSTKGILRLRQIPYLKIFLISFVWSTVTVFLPVTYSEKSFNKFHLLTVIVERFLFVMAITIPFDIRDMEADRQAGLKTIPLKIGVQKSIGLSLRILILFFVITVIHYCITDQWILVNAFTISFLATIIFLRNEKIRSMPLYYYGILDGTLLLQGFLVIVSYYINLIFSYKC